MKPQQLVRIALTCIQELDAREGTPVSFQEISFQHGLSEQDCQLVLRRLNHAGIVQFAESGMVVLLRPVEELTTLEVLQAVWNTRSAHPSFRMWVGGARGPRMRKTWEFARHTLAVSQEELING